MLALWSITLLAERRPVRFSLPLLSTGAAIGITTYVYYLSVQYISASLVIVLLMQFNWLSMLLERVLFGIRASRSQLWCVMAILGGTVMAAGLYWQISLRGAVYALSAAVLYSVYIVANSKTDKTIPSFQRSAIMMTGSTLSIVLLNAPSLAANPHFDWPLLPRTAFLALFGTIIPPVLFTRAIPHIGAGLSAILMTAKLPVAVICAHFVLQEPITLLQAAGFAIMLGVIALMHLRSAANV